MIRVNWKHVAIVLAVLPFVAILVAWIGSHHTFATEAAELGAGFTAGTCALAERYLSTHT